MSVEFRSWSWSSAVCPQVTEAIKPAIGCHYFPSGPWLPPQLPSHWPVSNDTAWWWRHVCKQLALDYTRLRGGWDSNQRPVDHKSGSLTTRSLSHIYKKIPVSPAVHRIPTFVFHPQSNLEILFTICLFVYLSLNNSVRHRLYGGANTSKRLNFVTTVI